MGDTLNMLGELGANYIIIEGVDRLGKYYRVKELTQANEDDLPKEAISAQKIELIHEEKPYLKCSQCGIQIDKNTKIYCDSGKVTSVDCLKVEDGYCKKHWRNRKVAEQL